jgi:hypothetical protein
MLRRRFKQTQSLKQRLVENVKRSREEAKLREYRVLVLTAEGLILDQHTLTCADDDEAKETVKLLADSTPVEVWNGPVRIVRFEPMQ